MNDLIFMAQMGAITAGSVLATIPLWRICEKRRRRLEKERKAARKTIDTTKPVTEKEQFIAAHMAQFHSTYEIAKEAYKTTDPSIRKLLIDMQKKGR